MEQRDQPQELQSQEHDHSHSQHDSQEFNSLSTGQVVNTQTGASSGANQPANSNISPRSNLSSRDEVVQRALETDQQHFEYNPTLIGQQRDSEGFKESGSQKGKTNIFSKERQTRADTTDQQTQLLIGDQMQQEYDGEEMSNTVPSDERSQLSPY